jgi:hypothetical protein
VILLAASCDQAGSEYLRKRSWSTASLSFPGAAAIASLAWTGIGKPSAVSRRNSPRVRGDAPLSPPPVLAACLVFVRGMESRPPHADPVSRQFLRSRRVAPGAFQNLLNPVPKVRVLASQVVAGHGRFRMCPFASYPINAGRRRIDPMPSRGLAGLQGARHALKADPMAPLAPIASMAVSGLPCASPQKSPARVVGSSGAG